MDACFAAREALSKSNYTEKKLRTEEVQMQCNATIMNDNRSHELLQDPMFESMMAVMEESERRWESVADFEKSVEARFKHIRKTDGPN